MGCSSSVAALSSAQSSSKELNSESHADNCKCLDVNVTEEVRRRSSVVTLKSGNIKVDAKTQNKTTELFRKNAPNSLSPNSSPAVNGARPRVVDSPAPFRKIGNGLMANSPSRMRIRNGNPFSSPHANRNATPLVEQEEDSDEENHPHAIKIKNNDTQQTRLNKALLELSASLSENHGNAFQMQLNQTKVSEIPNHKNVTISNNNCEKCGVIVIDTGSGFCKAGFSDEDMPSVVIPTLVGKTISNDVISGLKADTTFVGNGVKLRSDVLSLSNPVQRGVVQNWEDWSTVVGHVLNMELKVDKENISVVLPGSLLADRMHREKQVEVMFKKFHVEKLYLGCRAPMALHAFGMTSGLLLNLGHEVTTCVPVLNGNVQQKGIKILKLGGSDVTARLQKLIQNHEDTIKVNDKDDSIFRIMMERLCCVSAFGDEKQAKENVEKKNYILPCGTNITLHEERIMAPEILFYPKLLGDKYQNDYGLHEMCIESVKACQEISDVSSTLFKNVVLSGGASLLPGLAQRLEKEISSRVSQSNPVEVKVHSFPKRQYAIWRGAAHMTSLQLSRSRWMTKSEYDEHGASIIHRKYL